MSSTQAFIVALTALLSVVADLVSEKGPLYKISAAVRGWWRARHPLPATPAEEKAAEEFEIDGRIVDLKEHVRILKDLVDTSKAAAAAATAAAQAAQQSAEAANRSAEAAKVELARVTEELDLWHQWAVRWWPLLRTDASRQGVPDPPTMTDPAEEIP